MTKSQIIRNYVNMPPKSGYTAHMVAEYTGIKLRTVKNELSKLSVAGVIWISGRLNQQAVYSKAENIENYQKREVSDELISKIKNVLNEHPEYNQAQIARAINVSRQAVNLALKQMGITVTGKQIVPEYLGMIREALQVSHGSGVLVETLRMSKKEVMRYLHYLVKTGEVQYCKHCGQYRVKTDKKLTPLNPPSERGVISPGGEDAKG